MTALLKRDLGRLIGLGHLRPAMELSLELMAKGSYQVEMSDEGMMTEEIEECLQVVIEALQTGDLPVNEVAEWCMKMRKRDCVGFVCDEELQTLHQQCQASRPYRNECEQRFGAHGCEPLWKQEPASLNSRTRHS